ncbi:MAG: EAL domain-containing protein [Candidatus Thiodiazotropha sp.]
MHCLLHLAPHELATLGYTDLSLLSETDAFRIIRAYTHDKQAVLIKAPVSSDPSAKLIHQLEHEFAITSDLNTEYVVRPGKIERGTSLTALILEDCACQPLSSLLKAPLEIDYFLTLAMGITTALAEIHRGGLVHKDITPANIFVTADGRVKLSGFGFASRLSRERPTHAHLQEIAGTLAYMAPEQTGRMNRSIDTRSDLYSLGVVFYQMLTGQLPFNASDPMGWVHCHIAIQPISPQQQLSTIPAPLSKIVMKLLAKAAEERYQTAEGLKIDLQRCQDEWLEGESIEPFELGMQDISNHLVIPEKLYGRAREVKSLRSAVDRVVDNGNVEMLLVSGYAGIGKSALINEMRRSLVSPNVLYAEGKYDQFKRDIPYATLTQALQTLVRHILGRGKEEIAQWRDDLNNAIKPNARLVTDLVPDLVRLIGEQPAVAKVPPQEAQNRFQHVIRRLIEVFARPEHPLVLFLDDLQWLDNASLQLLEHLLTQSGLKHLLVLGAYRDNEVGQTHPLKRTVQVLRNREVRFSEIILKPLSIDDVCRLIVDTIHADEERVLPLADLVLKKTGGNPFFVNQFLTSLADENQLVFDPEIKEWIWYLDAIRAKSYSENVVDLMLQKLGGLPDETQQALKRLACLGTDTEIDSLAALSDQSETALHTALWGAVKVGLVLRDKTSYRFLHDRVQEAAYALIPEQDRPQLHLAIGRQLFARSFPDKLDDILFDVVNHLNRGAELITDPAEATQLAELNAAAARKARSSIAYATARELFSTAAAILSDEAWSNRYDFQFALYSDWAEAEFLCADYARAEFIFETLLTRADSDLDKARVYILRMHCYPTAGRFDDALVAGIEALRLLGQSVPDDAGAVSQAIANETETLQENLHTHSIRDIPQAPEVTDERARIMIDLLTGIAGPTYIGSRPELYPLFAYMNLNIIFQYGVSKEACIAFSAYAVLQTLSLDDLNGAYESSQSAIRLSERFGEPGLLGSVLYLHGNHINFWLNPFSSDFPILERGFDACIDGGNLAFANYIGYSIVWQAIERGDALGEVLESSNKYAGFARDSGNEPIRQSIVLEQQFVKCLMGKTDGALSFSDEAIDESASAAVIGKGGFTCGLAYYHSLKMLVAYLLGDDTAAHSHALEARQLQSSVLSQPMQVMFHFLDGLVLARSCNAADDEQREKTLQALAEHAQKLAFWADNAPANFACKHALVAAQIALLQRDTLSAEQLFERACETARTNNFIHWQAMASEAAARFYADRGLQTIARAYLHEALDCYARWGASAKVRQLQQQHTWLQPIPASPPGSLNHQLDTTALLEASQKLSGEVELGKLIKALMTLTLESAGADRGLLLLGRDRGYEVEVEATAVDADIQVKQLQTPINQIECAESVVNRVINTHQNILIDNTANPGEYSTDPYFQQMDAKCICCIPLLRQDELTGVLYLENSHTPGVFTHQRTAVLDLLAAQAAISLENANLYQNIKESENQYHNLVETVQAAIVVHTADTQIIAANPMAQNLLGLSEAQLLGKNSNDSDWHFLREDGSIMPVEEYPVNQVLATDSALHNILVGVDRPDREEPMWALVSALPVFDETHSITRVIVSFSDITERKKSEQQLVASEQLFRTLVENSPDHIARYDLNLNRVYINPVLEKTFKVPRDQALGKTSEVSSPLLDPENYMANLRKVITTGKEVADQIAYRTPQDEIHWASSRFAPEFDSHGKVKSVLVISNDITGQKRAELEQQEHTHFLESLDRINRALQLEGDIEQVLQRAIEEILDIFACDRAFLLYPCDPYASNWNIPIESTVSKFPGIGGQGPQPMNEHVSSILRTLLDAEHTVRMGPGTQHPIPQILREQFNIRSQMASILRPRIDSPWQFGIHQCSHDRIWSDQEMRLFEEISNRLTDGLNDLLFSQNLRKSEARFRLVFENSPVSIQEEDYSAVKTHLESLRPEYDDDLAGYLAAHPEVVKKCAGLVRYIDINQAAMVLHEADSKQEMLSGLTEIFVPETLDDFRDIVVSLMQGETNIRKETILQTLQGRRYTIEAFLSVSPGYEESLGKILVSLIDITELKQAEQTRRQHLHFLESLDRINQVLQAEADVETMLQRALDEVLEIFDCDRAYLQYPCDPDAASEWRMPIESCKPDYPSPLPPGKNLPYHPHIAETLRALLETDTPIQMGPHTDRPIPAEITNNLGVRSLMAVSIHPKVDRPWHFGIHQCSHERIWTDQEARLLEEISLRLSEGLNNLLITRNLRENEERFRLVYENSPVPIWEEDFSAVKSRLDELTQSNGADLEAYLDAHPEITKELVGLVRIVNINNATLELHEADSKEALLEGLPKTFIPESYDAFRKQLIALWRGETELRVDGAVQTLRGKRREVSVSFSVCPGYEQSLSKVFVSLFDITQRKQDEDGLRLAASVFSTSQEGILISDADNCIIDINPAFTSLTGYSREEALGQNPGFLSAGRQDQAFYAEMWRSINTTGEWQGELLNRRKSGEVFPELLSIVAVRDEQGQLQHYVGAFSDISVIKQHEADLDRIAHYDMLTSVPNRRLLGDRLDQAIAYTRRHGTNLAVCYLDLDGFKPINDQFGHEGGDRMLVEIARRLESMSRGEDTVARLGGDEFVLLWNNIETEGDCMRALERVLEKVAEPMLLEDQPVSVSASIGVTLYPDDDVDADSLLRHADHAMYTAKQLGKNCYKLFDARLERQISAQAELLSMIERGLDRGQFELYYQPKLDYTTGKVVGVEALLRWNDPILGLLGPAEFLSLIVNDSLAFRMGRWVLEEAICQAKIWDDMGITIPISINIFPRHLKFRSFVDDLRSAIESHWPQMPKHRLLIEIIESSDLEELEPIEMIIRECVELGIGFSLDDFGTGYSSLVYLRRLSIEELKIDQSFVRDMLDDPEDEAIVVGVISLGQAFGLRVVAEGVETSQQAEYLVNLGCPIVQGYGLGRPMPPRAFQKWYTGNYANELNIWQK